MKKDKNDTKNDNVDTKIFDYSTEQEKSKEIIARFTKAKTFSSERLDAYTELMAFYQGNQHLLSRYKTKQPWVINMNTPYAAFAIDNRVSSLISSDYIGELLPLSAEDTESLSKLAKVYKKEWERLGIDSNVVEAIKQGAVVRENYVHLFTKKGISGSGKSKRLGDLEVYNIDPGQVFIDPSAKNLKDAEYCFVNDRITKQKAIKDYPILKNVENSSTDTATPTDRGEVYIENDYETEQDNVWTRKTYYEKRNGKIYMAILILNIIVFEKELPITLFPIAQFRWKKAAQSCYGLGLMDDVLALQKAISSIESSVTNTTIAYAAPSLMVRKGCGVDPKVVAKTNGAPGIVYAVDGDLSNAIRPVVAPKVEDSVLNIKTDFEQKIDKITGNSSQFLGNIGTAGNTSSGAKMAIERAKIIEMDVLNNIKEFVKDITDILIEHIIIMYSGEIISAFDGKSDDGQGYKFIDIELPKEDILKDIKYKYYIKLETKTPYSKERQKETIMQLFQFERQYDVPIKTVTTLDVINNSDLENKEEFVNRFNQINKQDSTTKAETILELVATATENGIDQNIITGAVSEIVSNVGETPILDELMAMLEQGFQAQIEQSEQAINNAAGQLMGSPTSMREMDNAMAEMPQIEPQLNQAM